MAPKDKAETAKVVIAFDADNTRIGTTEDLPVEEARLLVREGRARWASGKEPAGGHQAPTVEPVLPAVVPLGADGPVPPASAEHQPAASQSAAEAAPSSTSAAPSS